MKKVIFFFLLNSLFSIGYSQTFYAELAFFYNNKGKLIDVGKFTPQTSEIILLEDRLIIWIEKGRIKLSSDCEIKEMRRIETSKTRTIYFSSLNGEIIYIYDKKKNYSMLKGNFFKSPMAFLLHDSSC